MNNPAKAELDPTIASKKRNRRIRLLLGCLFVLIACVGIAYGALYMIAYSLEGLFTTACSTDVPDRISNTENMSQFQFPPSATNIVTSCFGMQGWGAYAQFEMSPSDLDTFIASTRLTRDQFTSQAPQTPTPSRYLLDDAATMSSYLYGLHEENEFSQEILIDMSNPDLYVVYISILGW